MWKKSPPTTSPPAAPCPGRGGCAVTPFFRIYRYCFQWNTVSAGGHAQGLWFTRNRGLAQGELGLFFRIRPAAQVRFVNSACCRREPVRGACRNTGGVRKIPARFPAKKGSAGYTVSAPGRQTRKAPPVSDRANIGARATVVSVVAKRTGPVPRAVQP